MTRPRFKEQSTLPRLAQWHCQEPNPSLRTECGALPSRGSRRTSPHSVQSGDAVQNHWTSVNPNTRPGKKQHTTQSCAGGARARGSGLGASPACGFPHSGLFSFSKFKFPHLHNGVVTLSRVMRGLSSKSPFHSYPNTNTCLTPEEQKACWPDAASEEPSLLYALKHFLPSRKMTAWTCHPHKAATLVSWRWKGPLQAIWSQCGKLVSAGRALQSICSRVQATM